LGKDELILSFFYGANAMKNWNSYMKSAAISLSLALCGALASAPGHAAGNARPAGGGSYQQERQACLSGATAEDRATCLREAGAAQQAARHGDLSNGSDYERNALQRCQRLPPDDREDCERRVRGEGSSSGSVGGGGIYKELRRTIPAPDSSSQ
jgi:hypothetical protein